MSAPRLSCPMITVKVTFPRPRSRLWHIHTLSYHHFNTMALSNVHEFRSKVVPITDARVYGCCHQSTISSDDHLLGAWHYAKADVKESLVYLKWSCRRASRGRRDNQTSYQQQNITYIQFCAVQLYTGTVKLQQVTKLLDIELESAEDWTPDLRFE